jgi:hypothetical protein
VLIDRELPGKKFVNRQRISAASFLEGEKASAHGGDNLSLAANDPTFGPGRWQIGNR